MRKLRSTPPSLGLSGKGEMLLPSIMELLRISPQPSGVV
jgi:hypothetical protein